MLSTTHFCLRKYWKQRNRGDMRKIHLTRQFFEASGRHSDLIENTKKKLLDKVSGSMSAKFQVWIIFRLARRRDTRKYINKYTHKYTHAHIYKWNIFYRLLASRGFWLTELRQFSWKAIMTFLPIVVNFTAEHPSLPSKLI